jgi:hypothetical protein
MALFVTTCFATANAAAQQTVSDKAIAATIAELTQKYGSNNQMERGVRQTAAFWNAQDGSEADFTRFCLENYAATEEKKQTLYAKLSDAFEILFGAYSTMDIHLKMPVHVDGPDIAPIDELLGGYDVSSHFQEDMFANKVAFISMLNFPFYTLQEKNEAGKLWNRRQWGYARMGDLFVERAPASLKQDISAAAMAGENYIAGYNIMMGQLVNNKGTKLFPAGMKLLSHWNLRDELKSDYADKKQGLEKQQMIYTVMKHIVDQTIPKEIINSPAYEWNPFQNKTWKDGKEVTLAPEGSRRYEILLNQFKAQKAIDAYTPLYPTHIQRSFERGMEISSAEVEQLFTAYLSSPQVKEVAAIISKRLGRKLQPFDIWYDGFKARSIIPEAELTAKTQKLYPTAKAYGDDMFNILTKLGFSRSEAKRISGNVAIDPARGSGHAMGSESKAEKVRLRTRVGANGMDYKGYNIATHEFGHNVEQTISLHDVDDYMLHGVPNTAHTEALAFVFQKRDLDLLGYTGKNSDLETLQTLDTFWDVYEIMGVSLVDLHTWQWLYAHPDATATELKDAVVNCAKEVWNRFYAPVLGDKDSPVLAIYSHMINDPLYLSNYPFGFLIQFQLEQHFTKETLATEIERIYSQGRLTPQIWMKGAVENEISTQPLLDATENAIKTITKK